jgi:hypothetical protein
MNKQNEAQEMGCLVEFDHDDKSREALAVAVLEWL